MGISQLKRLALAGLLGTAVAAPGCTLPSASGPSMARSPASAGRLARSGSGRAPRVAGAQAQGTNASQESPVSRLTSSVSDSSFGKSVSSAFKKTKAKAADIVDGSSQPPSDPISLSAKPKPPDADFYVSLARLHEQSNNAKSAQELYGRALEMDERHLGALLGMARLHDRQGRMAEATRLYQQAANEHPKDAAALNDLGICYARQKMFTQSAEALARAVEAQPDKTLYRNNLATVLVEQNRIDEALVHMKAAHGDAVAHYNIGFLLNKRGDAQAALEQFAAAAQKDPSMEAARQWVETLAAQIAQSPSAQPLRSHSPGQAAPPGSPRMPSPSGPALSYGSQPVMRSPAAGLRPTAVAAPSSARTWRADASPAGEPWSVPDSFDDEPIADEAPLPEPPNDGVVEISDAPAEAQSEVRLRPLPPVDQTAFPPSRY